MSGTEISGLKGTGRINVKHDGVCPRDHPSRTSIPVAVPISRSASGAIVSTLLLSLLSVPGPY